MYAVYKKLDGQDQVLRVMGNGTSRYKFFWQVVKTVMQGLCF